MKCYYCNRNANPESAASAELAKPNDKGFFRTTYDKEYEMVFIDRCKICKLLHKMRTNTVVFFVVLGVGFFCIDGGWFIIDCAIGAIIGFIFSWIIFKPIQWIRKMKPLDKVESHPEVIELLHKGLKVKNVE